MKPKNKLSIVILGLLAVALTTGMNGGCGGKEYISTTYYYPNWMPDGRVIAVKGEIKQTQGAWGPVMSSTKVYMAAMDADGENEANLFELDDIVEEVTCSPTGEMIAYIFYNDLYVADYEGNSKTKIIDADYSNRVEYLDWSPDATKIVYSTGERKMCTVNIDGSGTLEVASSAEAVAWRVGDKIVYTPSTIGFNVCNSDGTGLYMLASSEGDYKDTGNDHQITNNGKVIYRGGNWSVLSIKLDGTSAEQLFIDYERSTLKLSFDNTKIVGGDLDQSDIVGIWVINTDGTNANKLR